MYVCGTLWMQSDSFPTEMINFYWDGFAPAFLVWGKIQTEWTQVSLLSVYFCRTYCMKDLFKTGAPEYAQATVKNNLN